MKIQRSLYVVLKYINLFTLVVIFKPYFKLLLYTCNLFQGKCI